MKMSGVSDEDVFVIHHFAGDVCYSSASFLEKNTDSLSAQFEGILLKSTSSVVVQMVEGAKLGPKAPDNPGDQSARGKKGLEPGQMSMHDVYMIHGAKANTSGQRRTGVALRYMPASSHFDRSLKPVDGQSGVPVSFATRPLWLLRGKDVSGHNDFEVGHRR